MMPLRPPLAALDEAVLYGLRHSLFDDRVGEALLRNYRLGVLEPRTEGMISHRVRRHQRMQAFHPNPFLPPRLVDGEILLGHDSAGRPIRITLPCCHWFVQGGTGSGKTNLAFHLLLQRVLAMQGSLLIDLRKREWRRILHLLRRQGVQVAVLGTGDLRINILALPDGMSPSAWAFRLSEILIGTLDVPAVACRILESAILDLYARFGVRTAHDPAPTLFDLFEYLRSRKEINHSARQALLDRLDPLLRGLGPKVLANRLGMRPDQIAQRHIILELTGASTVAQDLIINWILVSEFASRIERGAAMSTADWYVALDEAGRLCSGDGGGGGGGGGGGIDDLIGLVRGAGVSLSLSSLSAMDVSPRVLSNTVLRFLGRGSGADIESMGRSMHLSSEQVTFAIHSLLEAGTFLAHCSEGPWRHPFIVRVPLVAAASSHVELNGSVADGADFHSDGVEVTGINGNDGDNINIDFVHVGAPVREQDADRAAESVDASAWRVVPAPEFRGHGSDLIVRTKRQPSRGNSSSTPHVEAVNQTTPWRSPGEERFIRALLANPLQPSTKYTAIARVSPRSALTFRQHLLEKGWIQERRIDAPGRGRATILLEPTHSLVEAVERADRRAGGAA